MILSFKNMTSEDRWKGINQGSFKFREKEPEVHRGFRDNRILDILSICCWDK